MAGLLTSQAISFTGFIFLARLAPPHTFGAYAAASILLGASQIFTESGMRAAVIQRSDRVDEAASTAFVANIVGGFCLAALAAACAPLIGLFFHSDQIATAAAVIAGTIPINAASIVPGALLQRRVSFRFPFVGPLVSISYVVAAIATLASGLGLWGFVIATYASTSTSTLAVFALSGWRPSRKLVSLEMWRSLSKYGRPVLLSLFLREVGFAGSTAVVGRILGTGDLGRFRFAQRVALQVNSAVVYGSAYVLFPIFSRIWRDERRFQDSILRALRTLTLIVFPLSLVFIPLGEPFAVVFLGEQWRDTGPILMAMSGVGVALALDSISSEAFKATGRTEFLPRMHLLTAVVPLSLMLALKNLGAPGMGLGMSLGMIVVAAYATRALSDVARIPLRLFLAEIAPASGGALLMTAGVYLLDRQVVHAGENAGILGVSLFALDLVLAVALYFGSLFLLSKRSVSELKELAKLLLTRADDSASTAAG
jgi:PST family polysaccharide transporter